MIDRNLLAEAKAGDVDAQRCLGNIYENRKKGRPDSSRAVFWYQKAAEQGDSVAQFLLGLHYDHDDFEQALGWYRKAAEQGDADAQFRLADMYEEGFGLPVDFVQAAFWYRQAAERGKPDAQHSLAHAYAHGRGVRKNCAKAAAWYREAAENPQYEQATDAQRELGILYRNGLKDYAQAAVWFRKSAEDNDIDAFVNLADLCFDGLGVRRNPKQAVTWYRKAASLGSTRALVRLGEAYAEGKGVRQSFADAYYHLTLAAQKMDEKERVAEKKAARAGAKLTPAELSKARRRVKRHLLAKQIQEEKRILKLQKSQAKTGKKRVPVRPSKAGSLFR
jgi:TPR repeat protein